MIAPLAAPDLIYVAGYGRSGSTLLDTILGNHPLIFGAGEFTWLFQMARDHQACSCGLRLYDCPVWGAVLDGVREQVPLGDFYHAAEITTASERISGASQRTRAYCRLWRAAFEHLRRVTGKPIVVDSSKSCRRTIRRFPLLDALISSKSCLIHLVRSPVSVSISVARGSNRMLELGRRSSRPGGSLRALAGWCMANVAVELQKTGHAGQVAHVRYESLIADPRGVLHVLGQRLGLDPTPIVRQIEDGEPLSPGHGIAGNRMRRAGPIRLDVSAAASAAPARGD